VALDPPRPLVPLLPAKHLPTKINFELYCTRHADCRIHVLRRAREVHSSECRRQPQSIVREKERTIAELIPTSDDVARADGEGIGLGKVVSSTVRIFEEFAHVVKVQGAAQPIPSWEAPVRIRAAGSPDSNDPRVIDVHLHDLYLIIHTLFPLDIVQSCEDRKITQEARILALAGRLHMYDRFRALRVTRIADAAYEAWRTGELYGPRPASNVVDVIDYVRREKAGRFEGIGGAEFLGGFVVVTGRFVAQAPLVL